MLHPNRLAPMLVAATLAATAGLAPTPAAAGDVTITELVDYRVFLGTRDDRGQRWCLRRLRNAEDGSYDWEIREEIREVVGYAVNEARLQAVIDSTRYFCEYTRKGTNKTRVQVKGTVTFDPDDVY